MQQPVPDPAEVRQRPHEGGEGSGPAVREDVQQLLALPRVGRFRFDVLHVRVGQHALLEQNRKYGFADQQLAAEFRAELPEYRSVRGIHPNRNQTCAG